MIRKLFAPIFSFSKENAQLQAANARLRKELLDREYVQEALRNSERRFRSIWESSLDAMRLTDANGTILSVNRAFCELIGLPSEKLLGHSFTVAHHIEEAEANLQRYRDYFSKRSFNAHDYKKLRRHDGRTLDLEVSYSFVELDRPVLLAIFRDVTERKKQEEQKLALERKLLDSQKLESLGVLAGGIAHDFNNLLTAVLGNASLASLHVKGDPKMAGYLGNIEKASMRAAELCKQMLAYSGKTQFVMKCVDLNELVKDTAELLEVSIAKKSALRIELRPDLPGMSADPTQIRQVLMNLVINASEAIGDKPGLIRVRTGILQGDAEYFSGAYMASALRPGNYVFVEVSDTGCGMSAETRARIFDPFFTTKFTGRGLGLAAVLGIVRGHKGALKIQSELGEGSTFTFLVPSRTGDTERLEKEKNKNGMKWKGQGTILVVDDDPTVRAVTSRMVEQCGFEVVQAVDGQHGVEVFQEKKESIQAVVMDLTMPKLNGEEAFEEMRRLKPSVKVLLISGFTQPSDGPDFLNKGLSGFLQKPFTSEDLNEKLKEMVLSA